MSKVEYEDYIEYNVALIDENNKEYYLARLYAFGDSIHGRGNTYKEASETLKDAFNKHIDMCYKLKKDIPKPVEPEIGCGFTIDLDDIPESPNNWPSMGRPFIVCLPPPYLV